MNLAIDIKNLTKKFKDKLAVDNLNLQVYEGELFAFLGENGAGKTTTIKMLCCLTSPTGGDATLLGDSILTKELEVKDKINISPQETAVASNLSVKENLEFVAGIYGHNRTEQNELANKMIDTFELQAETNRKAKNLSGGYQRRLSIAMALISNPKILFLDEPTLGLDVRARLDLWKAIRSLKGKITIVLTTHYMEEVESLADRVGIMKNGKLVALGKIDELKEKTNTSSLEEAFLKIVDGEELYV